MRNTNKICVILIILFLFQRFSEVESLTTNGEYPDGEYPDVNIKNGGNKYTRDQLLLFSSYSEDLPGLKNVVDNLKRCIRRRGRRGGARARCRRRGSRTPMPMIVAGNVRSLRNKIDELTALTKWNYAFRESSMICLTETWLQKDDPDSVYNINGFTLIRGDRTEESGKIRGGGVCTYVNNNWCRNISIYEQCCQTDIEYLTLSLRPYYLPREFPKIFVTTVYIPPSANVKIAEKTLHDAVIKMQNSSPDAVNIITGDFNNCKFNHCIPNFKQYINFATRSDKLLDPFFCNVKCAYTSNKLSPLGISDHNLCHLIPVYKQALKRSKPTERLVYTWNEEVNNTLLGCIESTDFEVMYDGNSNIEQNVDVLNSYIDFCINNIVPKKVVRCFPNNKPWVTKELKVLLNRKKYLLGINDREELKSVQKSINSQISVCKNDYKQKVECMFKYDSKSAWNGLRALTGMKKSPVTPDVDNMNQFCNELNVFYARFDKHDFGNVRTGITNFLRCRESEAITISVDEVLKSLNAIKIGKAAGPDKIGSSVIKLCKEPLAPVLCKIYQKSLDDSFIPKIWKTSEIIPAPKKNPPTCKNDYRPIALTAIMMKCLERIVKNHLSHQVKPYVDRLQFAYTANRCVEDATLSLTDYVLSHVDKVNTIDQKRFAKILYVDFSSAFNTIQPHIMMQKLINMAVSPSLILWINEFLTGRPQYVKMGEVKSGTTVTNTGAPQGCVLSPLLFTLYTSDCRCNSDQCELFKYADDTALVGKCIKDDATYRDEVTRFTEWCDRNYLELNVKKTKEMVVDFRTSDIVHTPLFINNELVDKVTEYKYLGTIIDHRLTFNKNVDSVYKKAKSRLYFVRQLCKLKVDSRILELFYSSILQSVIAFSIACWYGNCSTEAKGKLTCIIKTCYKLGIANIPSLEEIYSKRVIQRCKVIVNDDLHPLHNLFNLMPSGKRMRSIKCRTARYNKSFVPACIRLINEQKLNVYI